VVVCLKYLLCEASGLETELDMQILYVASVIHLYIYCIYYVIHCCYGTYSGINVACFSCTTRKTWEKTGSIRNNVFWVLTALCFHD
jgi:hypothetical protein